MKDLLAYRHTPKFAKKGNYGIRSVNQCDLRAFFVTYQSSSSCFDEIPRNQFRTYSWVFERFARKQVMQDLDKLVWGPGDGTQPNQGGNGRFHDDWILQTSSTLSSVITWNIATLLCSMHALHWLLEWEVMTFQLYSIVADQWRSIQSLSVKLKKILWRIFELMSIVLILFIARSSLLVSNDSTRQLWCFFWSMTAIKLIMKIFLVISPFNAWLLTLEY